MAKHTRAELQDRLTELEELYRKDQEALEEVRGLLDQADSRRKKEPDNTRKWDKVLSNLERCLDEVRARKNAREISLAETRKALETAPESEEEEPEEEPVPPPPMEEEPGDEFALARAISEAEVDDLQRFTLEQLALVTSQIGETITEESFPELERLQAHLEFANQQRAAETEPPESEERRRQLLLRAAIDKMMNFQFEAMSKEEMKLVLSSQELMLRKLRPTDRDQRLRAKIETGISVIKRRLKAKS